MTHAFSIHYPRHLGRWLGGALAGTIVTGSLLALAWSATAQPATDPMIGPPFAVLEQLNLTPEQTTQLDQIRQTTRTELEAILTPSQREQWRQTLGSGGTFRDAFSALDLTDDQRNQVRSTLQAARQEATDVLTPEQRQQLRDQAQTMFRSHRWGAGQ